METGILTPLCHGEVAAFSETLGFPVPFLHQYYSICSWIILQETVFYVNAALSLRPVSQGLVQRCWCATAALEIAGGDVHPV